MVGFKTFWITLFTLLFLGACVPQTKQSKCDADEAFNAQLRTCVPVVPGPTEFMKIINPSPSSTLTRFVNDNSQQINFQIGISNPYGLPYTVTWERLYNGVTYSITPDTATTYSVYPVVMSSGVQIGIHAISVKLKDSNNKIVDTHNFEVVIGSTPMPYVNTFTPTDNVVSLTPVSPIQPFTTSIKNNNSVVTTFRTEWRVYKNGVEQVAYAFNQAFVSTVPTATHTSTYSLFNPATIGIGDYTVRAKLVNTMTSEIADEQQWLISIAHPPRTIVLARNIYTGSASPTFNALNIAYNRVPYSSSPVYNFVPTGGVAQGDYCVEFVDDEGTYVGNFIKVNYFLDGTTLIYTGFTSAGDSKVCLSDAPAGVKAAIAFNNSTSTNTQAHTIVARVVDVFTNTEYTGTTDVGVGLNYPFTWDFSVKPVNLAPTVSFTSNTNLSGITCGTAIGNLRPCNVTQDTPFTIGVTVSDDFYSTVANQNQFTYSIVLYRGNTPVAGQQCVKTLVDTTTTVPPSDFVGPDYLCTLTVPSSDTNGSILPTAEAWSVSMIVSDNGSPITGGSPQSSMAFTHSLTVAEYSNPLGTTISPQGVVVGTSTYLTATSSGYGTLTSAADGNDPLGNGASASYLTEGDTLNFNVRVADTEMDDYKVTVFFCSDFTAGCGTQVLIVPQVTVLKTDNAATKLSTHSYLIPENLLPVNTALNTSVPTYFKIVVADAPDTLPAGTPRELVVSTNVRNKNPAPSIDTTARVPSTVGPHRVVAGYPFSIDPGTVTDNSLVATEKNLSYQWYVSPDNTTFSAIGGSTSRVLIWTPSLAYGATAFLKLCISDGTAVYPLSANFLGVCTGTRASNSYQIDVRTNMTIPNLAGVIGTIDPSTGAVWYDSSLGNGNVAYTASIEFDGVSDYYINVSKLVRLTSGVNIDSWSNTFQNVRFKALQIATASAPTGLSITGNATSLYIAYKCAPSSAPLNAKACIRRIEKDYIVPNNQKTLLDHPGKFGFSYAGVVISENDANITYSAPAAGSNYSIDFSAGVPVSGNTVTVNGVAFTADGNLNGVIEAGEFCGSPTSPGCTTTLAAAGMRNLINDSVVSGLQGLSATLVGDIVSISGMKVLDSYDSGATVLEVGKIVIDGTSANWHLPIINSSLAGSNVNRISILSSPVDTYLSTAVVTQTDHVTWDRANTLANDIDDNGNLVVALISTEPGRIGSGRLYNVGFVGSTFSSAPSVGVALFGAEPISYLRMSASRGVNAFNYVAAYGNTTMKWKIARHGEVGLALNNTLVQDLEDLTPNPGTGADDVVVSAEVKDIQLVTDPSINGEARLAVSHFGPSVADGSYFLRWTAANVLGCAEDSSVGVCTPISTFGTDTNSRVYLSYPQTAVASGVAGYSVGENTTDIVHALLFSAAAATPRHLVINIVPESIQGNDTSLANGTSGWRPPYVK